MPIDLGTAYAESRERLTALVAERPGEAKAIRVACCPGWSVHGVVSHLVAVAEDAVAGRLTGPPTDEQAAGQVARRAEMSTEQVLADWAEAAPALEELLRQVPVWPALLDVLAHEHDVRAAVGRPGARDIPEIHVCARRLIKSLDTGIALAVTMDGEELLPGGPDGGADEPVLRLETTSWEAFRFRLGRRSRRQLRAMRWTGDPGPVLEKLTIFGPNPADIEE